jgi:hypothetical protein
MLRLLLHWIVNAVALLIVSKIVPGFQVATLGAALIAVIVIGLLNATLGLLLKIITLPLGYPDAWNVFPGDQRLHLEAFQRIGAGIRTSRPLAPRSSAPSCWR